MLKPIKPNKPRKPQINDVDSQYIKTKVVFDEVATQIDLQELIKFANVPGAKLSLYIACNNYDLHYNMDNDCPNDFVIKILVTVDDVIYLSHDEIKNRFNQLVESYNYRLESYESEIVNYENKLKQYEAKQLKKEAKLKAKLEKQLEQLNAKSK